MTKLNHSCAHLLFITSPPLLVDQLGLPNPPCCVDIHWHVSLIKIIHFQIFPTWIWFFILSFLIQNATGLLLPKNGLSESKWSCLVDISNGNIFEQQSDCIQCQLFNFDYCVVTKRGAYRDRERPRETETQRHIDTEITELDNGRVQRSYQYKKEKTETGTTNSRYVTCK